MILCCKKKRRAQARLVLRGLRLMIVMRHSVREVHLASLAFSHISTHCSSDGNCYV